MGYYIPVNRITISTILFFLLLPNLNSVLSDSDVCVKNRQCLKLSQCQYAIDKMDDGEFDELIRCDVHSDGEPSYCCPVSTCKDCDFRPLNGSAHEIANLYCAKISNMFKKRLIMPSGDLTEINECPLMDVPVIINGEVSKIGEFPHMALLGYVHKLDPSFISWQCGGTLISDRFVLTAKHCYSQNPNDPIPIEDSNEDYNNDDIAEDKEYSFHPVTKVLLGAHDYNSTEGYNLMELYVVSRFIAFDADRETAYNDIALIQLDRKVQFSKHIFPACLNIENFYNLENYIITGWGEYRQDQGPSSVMLKGVIQLYDDDVCVEKLSRVDSGYLEDGAQIDIQICGGTKSLENITQSYNQCQGDSGGPLQYYNGNCSYTVIGIVSTTIAKCNTIGFPAIYTRVYGYIDWIVNIAWKN